jgi:hypothetical protein
MDPNLEYEALNGLNQMGEEAAPAIDDIAKHLANPDGAMRALTVEILERFGPRAAAHKATLEKMATEDPDPIVKFYCQRALEAIGSSSQ